MLIQTEMAKYNFALETSKLFQSWMKKKEKKPKSASCMVLRSDNPENRSHLPFIWTLSPFLNDQNQTIKKCHIYQWAVILIVFSSH